MRKFAILSLLLAALTVVPGQSRAASYVAQDVWYSTIYGGMIGAVAGGGVVLLTENPRQNLDYVKTGAGVGILGGLVYGILSYASMSHARPNSLAAVDADGSTTYGVPMPQPFVADRETGELGARMNLVQGRF